MHPLARLWYWLTEPNPVSESARTEHVLFGHQHGRQPKIAPEAAQDSADDSCAEQSAKASEDNLRRLMGLALSTPTPDAIMTFVDFTSRMKRLGPYNMLMVYAQRPGAHSVATATDWARVGQKVRPDAIPIIILRPRGPIDYVFELSDTLPEQLRDPRYHSLGATGPFDPARLAKLIATLRKSTKRKLHVEVVEEDYGGLLAGQISRCGLFEPSRPGSWLGATDAREAVKLVRRAIWRIKLNRRMTPPEKFATLLHELGHLFCGHLGSFEADNPAADEYGWPDRSDLPLAVREIEAELVAWHMCEREGLVTGSPLYLRHHMQEAGDDVAKVELDRVIRAIARVRAYLGDPKPAPSGGPA